MFSIFHLWEHTQSLVKKLFEIDMETVITVYMIHDLLTSPQGYLFDPRMTSLLAFYSARHPRRFDMAHDHVWKKKLTPLGTPAPKSPTQGAWPRWQNENPVWYVLYLSIVRTHTKFGIKIFEIDILSDIWPFDLTHDYQFDPRMEILLAYCSARHPRRFDVPHYYVWKIKITPWAPPAP